MQVAFVGDLGLSSRLLADPESHISPGLVQILRSCDMAVANLELPIRVEGASTAPYSHPSLAGRLEAWPLVTGAGFGALCFASNHCLDSGRKGIAFTRYLAARSGIQIFGAGLDETEARRPAIADVAGRRLGLLGYCKKGPFTASGTRAGAALLSAGNMRADIPKVRRMCDVLVVSMHAGMEFMEEAHPDVVGLARLAVDLGADCVIGHHPHVVQPVEIYRGKPIFYSLGNFLFDNRAGAAFCEIKWRERHRSLLAVVSFRDDSHPAFETIPVEYDPDDLTVRQAPPSGIEPVSPPARPSSGAALDSRGLRRNARRELMTIAALTRLHGPSFLFSLASDIRPRHLRMIWNSILRMKMVKTV